MNSVNFPNYYYVVRIMKYGFPTSLVVYMMGDKLNKHHKLERRYN